MYQGGRNCFLFHCRAFVAITPSTFCPHGVMLSERRAKYDIANVGYLTKEEAINRKPTA